MTGRRTGIRNERGAALLLAMTLMLLLAAAGAAAALTVRMETLLSGAFKQSTDALFIAEGGLARAIGRGGLVQAVPRGTLG